MHLALSRLATASVGSRARYGWVLLAAAHGRTGSNLASLRHTPENEEQRALDLATRVGKLDHVIGYGGSRAAPLTGGVSSCPSKLIEVLNLSHRQRGRPKQPASV